MNSGFIQQLLLFEIMGWKIDPEHPGYKHHNFFKLKTQIEEQGWNLRTKPSNTLIFYDFVSLIVGDTYLFTCV